MTGKQRWLSQAVVLFVATATNAVAVDMPCWRGPDGNGTVGELPASGTVVSNEPLPGVRVTYFKGQNFAQEIMETYERELRFDTWLPLSLDPKDAATGPWSIRWDALLVVPASATYTFEMSWGSHVALRLNGEAVPLTVGRTKTPRLVTPKPVRLKAGLIPIQMEITGDALPKSAMQIRWKQDAGKMHPFSPVDVRVKPWKGMRTRPMLRYAMVGHSNVEGRAEPWAGKGTRSWWWDKNARAWRPTCLKICDNNTTELVDELSQKYPDLYFGGVELGQASGSVCRHWLPSRRKYIEARQEILDTAYAGPLILMGIHFDWDEMKTDDRAAAFEASCKAVINGLRADLGRPEIPFLFARATQRKDWMGYKKRWNQVYGAADRIKAELPNIAIVESDDMKLIQDGMSKWHYTQEDYELWVRRALPLVEAFGVIEEGHRRWDRLPPPYSAEAPLAGEWPISEDPEEVLGQLHVTLTRASKARSPKELGTYPDGLVVHAYHVDWGRLPGKRLVAVHRSVQNHKALPAASFEVGKEYSVVITSWDAQPEAIRNLPLDDDILELETPMYFVTYAEPGHTKSPLASYRNRQRKRDRDKWDALSLAELIATAKEAEPADRQAALHALVRRDPRAATAMPVILAACNDANEDVRMAAGTALVRCGGDTLAPPEAIPGLIAILPVYAPNIGYPAASMLARMGPQGEAALLKALQSHPSPRARWRAAYAFGKMGAKAAKVLPEIEAAIARAVHPVEKNVMGEAIANIKKGK